ncbi:CYFA0S22e01530g1_1 [Cyberlindnera fabianii]|uniref:RNA polymerase II subunit B1 CTD phosphatase RPAP2 homolog n=1 Tax=Cyberlindnera fabianii TaxID=36022 RepID=A0A061BA58_CYBFA|nr:CYFA0S22e01530g1_1 [Cyberlindnera fabianii]
MKTTTIDGFKESLLPFSHPGNLTPAEANRLNLALVEELSDNVCDKFFLKFASRFLTKAQYAEIVEERNINRYCGYPLCQQHQDRINSTSRARNAHLLPYAYLSAYCSKRHYQCSEFYRTQLSDEAVFARKDVTVEPYGSQRMKSYELDTTLLEEVLDEYDKRVTDGSQTSVMDIVRSLDSLSLNGKHKAQQSNEEVMENMGKMLEDIKIVENDPQEESTAPIMTQDYDDDRDIPDDYKYEYLQDQSKAIDGYVLKM